MKKYRKTQRGDQTSEAESHGHRSRPFRDKTYQGMTTTRTTRRTHSRPGVVSDHSDQWLDITKEPSDQSQMSTSSWAGPLPQGSDQVSIQKASQANQCREENPADDTASYFVKFPSFIKRKQLEDHIESHGFGDIIIGIEMHCINASNKRPAGSAKISIMPASLHDEFISALNGSRLLGKHYLSVEPYYERKQRRTIEPPRKASQTKQKPLVKEPCVVFVGPVLPNYINRAHIQAHFREYKDTITDIQFKGDRQRRGCHVLLTFKSSSSAMRAIDGYNHTSLLGKHKIKLDIYEPHHPMPSSASCPTMSVSTASAVRTPNTKSKQASSTEIVSSSILKDETHGNINIKHQSVGGYSMGQLSSSCDLEIRSTHGAAVVNKELVSNYSDSEEDQLQNTVTTVIIENLDSSVTQEEIESLTGVVITCYTPSHLTPSKVAAWVEVANSKCAYTVAEKLDGRVIYGKEVYCSLTDSHTMQQQMHNFSTFIDPPEKELPSAQSVPPSSLTDSHVPQLHIQSFPTFEDPHKEPLHLSQTIPPSSVESFMSGSLTSAAQQNTHSSPTFRDPPQEQVPMPRTISDHIVQQEYLTLFYLGDQHSLQQPQATFPQESTAPFVIPSNLQLPKHEPGPPITATPLRAERIVALNQQEWNHLTYMPHKSGTMLLQEVIAPFETNPNVEIELQVGTCSIKICGVPDAVISAYDHITNQLNKNLHVQSRTEMAALVHLHPTLAHDITERHTVAVAGFQETSTVLKFEGAMSAVKAARIEVDTVLKQLNITWLTPAFHPSIFPLAKAQLKRDECTVYIFVPEMADDPTACISGMVAVCTSDVSTREKAVTLFQSIPKEKEVLLPYTVIDKGSITKSLKQIEDKFCIMIKQELQNKGEQLQGSQHEDTKVIMLGFQEQSLKGAHEELQSLIKIHSEQTITLDCKPEEVIYLLRIKGEESRSLFSSLPAKVIIKDNEIKLFGSTESIEKSKEKIHCGPLLNLHSKRFQFQCNSKFQSQIKESLLKPLKVEQKLDFQWLIFQSESQSSRKSDEQPRSESCTEADRFDIILYSKDESAFNKVCETLEVVDPQTAQFQLTYQQRREAADCARRLKGSLEAKCHVRMIVLQNNSAVILHGLIPHEMQKCWEDINSEIKATVSITKYIPLKRHESKYLERKYCDNFKKEFNCDIAFPQQKNNESYAMRVVGKIKDVEAVEDKLSKLKAGIEMRIFTITCSQKSYFMWRKWWFDFQKQKEDTHDAMIHFDITGKKMSRDGRPIVEVTFEVIGTDKDVIVSIQDTINNEKTEQRIFDILEEGKVALVNAMKQQRLPISDKLAIAIDIDQLNNKVMLVSPKSLSNDLNIAESEIRKFVGMYANISKEVTSQDPVVGLVLASPSLSSDYLKLANDIAKPLKVTVIAVGAPLFGLRLTGSPSAIQKVEPQIHATVFKKIEKILGQTWLKLPSNQAVVLATSEFSQLETKLQSEYCVILSYPRPGLSSKAVHTTTVNPSSSSHQLQLDICLGNIVHERVDAIVNAANEDLKHIGGLAKGILDSGGVTIQSESNQYVQSHGKVLTGTCVCLGAGKLPCKRIIHAVGPQWRGGGKGEEETLYNTVYKCLECAEKESLSSIALPAISTGVYGVPEVVCARASLTAVRNYCQSTADTNVSKVRFVLYTKSALQHFGSAFKYMFPSQSHTSIKSVSPTPSEPEVADTWSWANDQGSFSSYSSDIAAQLTKEYKRDPTSSVICTINRQTYRIDFNRMVQTNCSTRYQRKVQRVPSSHAPFASASHSNQNVHWEYRDDHRHWSPYAAHESQAIEEMYKDKTPGEISIGGNTYTFDFIHMYQINIRTRYKRQIQRVKAASSTIAVGKESALEQDQEVQMATTDSANDKLEQKDDHQPKDTETLTITLRGPFDALSQAKAELQEKMKSLFLSQMIPFPPTLEKKLTQLVQEHNIKWSLEKSSSGGKRNKRRRKVFKLHIEGLASEVNRVMMAVQEEIVTHQIESESDGAIEFPEEWEEMGDLTTKIVPLNPSTDEWRKVSQKFLETLPSTRIVEITRIQNKWLWEKYVFQRKRMHAKNDGKINELELFHGTRSNDPKLIYENEDGFDMRYSNSGMWGQANYFAENASYSNGYAHTSYDGYREMFFAKVLTGDSLDSSPNSSLRKPPSKPGGLTGGSLQFGQAQYDTVTGYTGGSKVYMTYDNDKAYPAYLIKYQ